MEEIGGEKGRKKDYVVFGELKIRRFEEGKKDTEKILRLLGNILSEYGFTIQEAGSEKDCKDISGSYRSGGFWVVENKDGEIIGTGGYRRFARGTTENYGELRRLYIDRCYRRLGLGGLLLEVMESMAYSAGYTGMILESASALVEARKLYIAHGYEDDELPCGASLSNRCDVVMTKRLHFDSSRVHVVDETGQRFAAVAAHLAKRGRMRLQCVLVVRVKVCPFQQNVLIRVLTGSEKVSNLVQSLVSSSSATESGSETISLVARAMHAERKETKLCCDVYMTPSWDVTQLDRSKWLSENETKFILDNNPSLKALIESLWS